MSVWIDGRVHGEMPPQGTVARRYPFRRILMILSKGDDDNRSFLEKRFKASKGRPHGENTPLLWTPFVETSGSSSLRRRGAANTNQLAHTEMLDPSPASRSLTAVFTCHNPMMSETPAAWISKGCKIQKARICTTTTPFASEMFGEMGGRERKRKCLVGDGMR